jgi:uncharacterized protein
VRQDAHVELALMAQELAVCRLEEHDPVPDWAWRGELVSITRARRELSIICAAGAVPEGIAKVERGWRTLVVTTEMDFSLTGVAASITAPLAEAGVSVLPVATYDTDYFLVKEERLADAIEALLAAGHRVTA